MSQTTTAQRVREAILQLDPTAHGSLTLARDTIGHVRVFANLFTSLDSPGDLVRKAVTQVLPNETILIVLQAASALTVNASVGEGMESSPSPATTSFEHGWAQVLFTGRLPCELLTPATTHKKTNPQTIYKVGNCVAELGFVAPIVLNRHLEVIDGNLRLALALELGMATVPVVVVDVEASKADFLRLVLNRASEFQHWVYEDVYAFVDAMPQLAPLLEPLGFFGEQLLPASFFGESIVNYKIDDRDRGQQQYRQEVGIAQWAEIQRQRMEKEELQRAERRYLSDPQAPRLFDLTPNEDDFIPVYDIDAEVGSVVRETKELAQELTETSDIAARARKASTGQAWQVSRQRASQGDE